MCALALMPLYSEQKDGTPESDQEVHLSGARLADGGDLGGLAEAVDMPVSGITEVAGSACDWPHSSAGD